MLGRKARKDVGLFDVILLNPSQKEEYLIVSQRTSPPFDILMLSDKRSHRSGYFQGGKPVTIKQAKWCKSLGDEDAGHQILRKTKKGKKDRKKETEQKKKRLSPEFTKLKKKSHIYEK